MPVWSRCYWRADANPQYRQDFCATCGDATLMDCEHCHAPIKGAFRNGWEDPREPVGSFCHACGNAYPWTDAALLTAKTLADELDTLSREERDLLKGSLDDLVRDAPATPLAAFRFKRIVAKAGQEAPGFFRELLVGITSDATMKLAGNADDIAAVA
jgi:hypothetical protein